MGRNSKKRRDSKTRKKRKRKKNQAKTTSSKSTTSPMFQKANVELQFMAPRTPEEQEQLLQLHRTRAKECKDTFDGDLTMLREMLDRQSGTFLLASLHFYCLLYHGEKSRKLQRREPVESDQCELLQALLLMKEDGFKKGSSGPPTAAESWEIGNRAREIGWKFIWKRSDGVDHEASKEFRVLESARNSTQGIRNYGYPTQIASFNESLFTKFDDVFNEAFGCGAGDILRIFENWALTVAKKLNEFRVAKKKILSANTLKKALKQAQAAIPSLRKSDELYETLRNQPLSDAKTIIAAYHDLFLADLYDISSIAPPDDVQSKSSDIILERLALKPGSLADQDPEHFFLNNPVWTKPFVKLESTVFAPNLNLLVAYSYEILESLLLDAGGEKKKLEDERGRFLECRLEDHIKKAFPKRPVESGVKWKVENDVFETDLLLVHDDTLVVFEAKSGRITSPARRGAAKRLKSVLKTLIEEPSIQSSRLLRKLQEDGKVRFERNDGSNFELSLDAFNRVIRLNVTLDPIHVLLGWRELRDAGFLPEILEPTPTLCLFDLEMLFDVLEDEYDRIHYFKQRASFEKKARYAADEYDLLAVYLENRLIVADDLLDETPMCLLGMSEELDHLFRQKMAGLEVDTWDRRLTKRWANIVERLPDLPGGRTSTCLYFLDFPLDRQIELETNLAKLKKAELKGGESAGGFAAVVFGQRNDRKCVIFLVYDGQNVSREQRQERIANAVRLQAQESSDAFSDILVSAHDARKMTFPYDSLQHVIAPDASS